MATAKHTSPPNGFTHAFLDNIKPKAARYELPDNGKPGMFTARLPADAMHPSG